MSDSKAEGVDLITNLGLDVTLDKVKLENDSWAQKMLNEIGSTMRVDGKKYIGSIAVHYYIDETAMLKSSYSMDSKTQIAIIADVNEQLIALGWNNAGIDVRAHFNPNWKYKTTRKGDKR